MAGAGGLLARLCRSCYPSRRYRLSFVLCVCVWPVPIARAPARAQMGPLHLCIPALTTPCAAFWLHDAEKGRLGWAKDSGIGGGLQGRPARNPWREMAGKLSLDVYLYTAASSGVVAGALIALPATRISCTRRPPMLTLARCWYCALPLAVLGLVAVRRAFACPLAPLASHPCLVGG